VAVTDDQRYGRFLRLSEKNRRKMWKGARTAIVVLVGIVLLLLLFGGDFGLVSLYSYRRFERKIEKQIVSEKARQDSLKTVMMKLNTDDTFKERLAREKLRMVKDGETIYRFTEQKNGITE
jgi:cell division protein FtsB